MKNIDLIGLIIALVVLLAVGAVFAFTEKQILSTDLLAVMAAYVVAAFARWRAEPSKK